PTRAANLIPNRFVLLLPSPLQGRHEIKLRPVRQSGNLVDDLIRRLRANRDVASRTIKLSQSRVEDAQIIVDLRHRADGRARALAGRFLLDADGRGQPGDVLDLWFLHLPEKLPGISRQ